MHKNNKLVSVTSIINNQEPTLRNDEELAVIALLAISNTSLSPRKHKHSRRKRESGSKSQLKKLKLICGEMKKIRAKILNYVNKIVAISEQRRTRHPHRQALRDATTKKLKQNVDRLRNRFNLLSTELAATKVIVERQLVNRDERVTPHRQATLNCDVA